MSVSTKQRVAFLALGVTLVLFPERLPAKPLESSSAEGRAAVLAMVEAHGSLNRWRDAAAVSFEDEFAAGGQPPQKSLVTVEQGRRRAYIDIPASNARLAWDGQRAWSEGWKSPSPPRFLALLNYYFLNLPWLTMDPGVRLGDPGAGRLRDDPTEYVTVKMTFADGVGDTPRDYYLLYIDPATNRLKACEYIVTYRSLLPPGVEATSPHVLVFEEWETVTGLLVPTRYTIFDKDGTVYGTCRIRDWSFSRPFDETRMRMPKGAVLDTSQP